MKRLALAAAAALLIAAALIQGAGAETTVGQSGWNWGNPQPQGHTLRALDFAGGRGYAVGDFGTLVRSDDGGSSSASSQRRSISSSSRPLPRKTLQVKAKRAGSTS